MPKMKTHKGILKRVRITARGKVRFKRPNSNHLMSGKSGNRCRWVRRPGILGKQLARRLLLATGTARKYRPAKPALAEEPAKS